MQNKKVKILYLIESLQMGGAEKLVVDVLKGLDRSRYLPFACSFVNKPDMSKELQDAGISTICLNLKSYYSWLEAIYKLYRLMRHEKFDIVHTHLYFANIYGRIAGKLTGVGQIITTLHNADYTFEDNGRITYKVRKLIDKYTGHFCNTGFIAVSEHVKRDFEKHLGFKGIETIYNCLDFSKLKSRVPQKIMDKKRELGIKEDDFVLLNIGRLHPQKGQSYLLESFSKISSEFINCKLIIVGKGGLEQELKAQAVDLNLKDKVIFLKSREDIAEILNIADIFVFPSIYEGLSIALAEAMAAGVPIVASDIEAINSICRNQKEGILVEAKNSQKLAETVIALIKNRDKRGELAGNAQKRAKELFDIQTHLDSLEKIYKIKHKTCLVCGCDSSRKTIFGGYFYHEKEYFIKKCRSCGFMFVDPIPSEETLLEIYSDNSYFDNYYATSSGIKGYTDGMQERVQSYEKTIDLIKLSKQSGRLLDIGCSAGGFLMQAVKSGFSGFGIEPNKTMADYAKNKLGLSVHCGNLDNFVLGEEFDVIHASDVLEHLPNLKQNLLIIKNLLKKDGILVISQPLMYNKSFFTLTLRLNMFLKKNRLSPYPPLHLWEFTPRTLNAFLRNEGFKIVYCKVSESKGKPLESYTLPSIKNKISYHLKNASSFISNQAIFRGLKLGDRVMLVCRKA